MQAPTSGCSCCLFDYDVSIIVDSLFVVPPCVLWDFLFGHCFIVHHYVSFLHLQSSRFLEVFL